MMADWSELVVSGIDKPRVLLISENFCTNPYFVKGIEGWIVSGATLSRVEDVAAYYQYMGSVEFGGESNYVEYQFDFGSSVVGKKFLVALNTQSASEFRIVFHAGVEFGETIFDSQSINKSFIIGLATAAGITGNTISFRIYGSGTLLFDNVYFAEVLQDITMPQPHDSGELLFNKEVNGVGELWTGKKKEYNARWTPSYIANYFYLSEQNEEYRQLISENPDVFFIPHLDFDWGFVGKWMKDGFERNYSFNQFDGHSGELVIKGQEYINQTFVTDLIVYFQVLVTAYVPE